MRESWLFYIETDPAGRIWGGVGDLVIPSGGPTGTAGTYSGAGEWTGLPDFQQIMNALAERLDIEVSGVTAETLRYAIEDKTEIEGATIRIGSVKFNEDWSIASTEWEATYRADKLSVTRNAQATRSITLSVGSETTNRSRAPLAFFTDADQRLRSASDAIFDHVAAMEMGSFRRFGAGDGKGKNKDKGKK